MNVVAHSPHLPHLKAIFFDLDNVLVFSEDMHTKAWNILLTELGAECSQIDFISMVGMSESLQSEIFIKQFRLNITPELLCERKRETYLKIISNGFESAEGRNQLLEKLSQKFITGVVSSSAHRVIKEVLHLEKISSLFKFIIGHEDCERHKPDPLPYLNALKIANVQPHEALVIEDSVTGITAALNANIPVIGLFKDQTPEQILKDVKYFKSFEEISNELFYA